MLEHGDGGLVNSQNPAIISASRSTDIPAFYAEWFMKRLREGYVVWKNPFNQKKSCISFKNAGGIVFWTKNPKPLMPFLDEVSELGYDYYFQFTVNDYESEGFEPNVPPLDERIETFRSLSQKLGKERVIWRFDPICLTRELDVEGIMARLRSIGERLKGYTEQLVISFVDVHAYTKVQRNIKTADGFCLREPSMEEQDELARRISSYAKEIGVSPSACGERRSFAHFGILPNKCIDGELFKRICQKGNIKLQKHLGTYIDQYSLLSPQKKDVPLCKDKGQRKECGCVESKDIGMYNTCNHMCVYCYANTSQRVVEKNRVLHDVNGESLIPTSRTVEE